MGVQKIEFNFNPLATVAGLASMIKPKSKHGWLLNLADMSSSELVGRSNHIDLGSMGENGISEEVEKHPKACEILNVFTNAMALADEHNMAISNMWAMYIPQKKISGYIQQSASTYIFPLVTGEYSYFMPGLGEHVTPLVTGSAYLVKGVFSLLNGNMEQPTIVMGVTLREIHS